MPDIFYLISKWWKQILVLIGLSLLIVSAIVFLQPARYLSVATALPASPVLSDKARIFNNNIEGLYSSMGGSDDLDKIMGTANLDTVYLSVAATFNLWDHYKSRKKGQEALEEAALILKKNTRVIRSEYGELKIKVWDTDKSLAPQLANTVLEKLNAIHQALHNESNIFTLNVLKNARNKLQYSIDTVSKAIKRSDAPADSIRSALTHRTIQDGQLQQYERLIGEYQVIVDANSPVLVVVEKARPSEQPDQPKTLLLLTATAVLSFLFALLVALIIERRKKLHRD